MPPRVGVAIIIRKGDRVLLTLRQGSHGAGTWATPGGHLDHGEMPEACAAREALEEVGVTIGPPTFRALTNDVFADEGKHYITIWMEADWVAGEPTIASARELTELGWFRWDDLPSPLFLPLRNLLEGRSYGPP
ncbi:MAG: NUDIX domain-containing protein [Gemmatimonadales bacterium]